MQMGIFDYAPPYLHLLQALEVESRDYNVAKTFSSAQNFLNFIQNLIARLPCECPEPFRVWYAWRALPPLDATGHVGE